MDNMVRSYTDQISLVFSDFVMAESCEGAFSHLLPARGECAPGRQTSACEEQLTHIISQLSGSDQMDAVLALIAARIAELPAKRMTTFMTIIERCALRGALPAKPLCEAFLNSRHLVLSNRQLWLQSFALIRNIIHKVDYKGVRELMKVCFERVRLLPAEITPQVRAQVHVITNLIKHIFNREAALLPAYFVNNEIVRSYPDYKNLPHWKLAGLLENFMAQFRLTAQMVTIIERNNMLPIVDYTSQLSNCWRLDMNTLRFHFKGNLPYDRTLARPQRSVVMHIISQPYSREVVCSLLGLQKQQKVRCVALEDCLVDVIFDSMQWLERNPQEVYSENVIAVWQHLSSQLIYFVLFCFCDFSQILIKLHAKLKSGQWLNSRDHLMWILLNYISGTITKNSFTGFLPALLLLTRLYETPPAADTHQSATNQNASGRVLPAPDYTRPSPHGQFDTVLQMCAVSVWTHLYKKASQEHSHVPAALPHVLSARHETLMQLLSAQTGAGTGAGVSVENEGRLALLCNAFSTHNEYAQRHMNIVIEFIQGMQHQRTLIPMPGINCTAMGSIVPLRFALLDIFTIHVKMSLIHAISLTINKAASASGTAHKGTASGHCLPPSLIETFTRLLVYVELDTLGIKSLTGTLLPAVFKAGAYGILHTLLEIFCYRLRHIPPHYRFSLLNTLNSLNGSAQANNTQLNICVNSTALHIITGLGNSELHTQLNRYMNEPKAIVSADSEELNRLLVLTIVRAIHVTGNDALNGLWCKDILAAIQQYTPLTWSSHTLALFPPAIREFYKQNPGTNSHSGADSRPDRQLMRNMVDEEYRKFMSLNSETELLSLFSVPATPNNAFFICLLWKMLVETGRIPPLTYKIMERIGAKYMTYHLRAFCDYVIGRFSTAPDSGHFQKYLDAITSLLWHYDIFTLDRFVLFMILRPFESAELRVVHLVIQMLLIVPSSVMVERVQYFVKENNPRFWLQDRWHEKHMAFHQRFPERFAPEDILADQKVKSYQSYPIYFGNICLRFLPVLDILIQRILENPQSDAILLILEHMGHLYKFHARPISFLYNTLSHYEKQLSDMAAEVKRKLVSKLLLAASQHTDILGSFSEEFQQYLNFSSSLFNLNDIGYYERILARLINGLQDSSTAACGATPAATTSSASTATAGSASQTANSINRWRFSEFPNLGVHTLYCVCVELITLPLGGTVITQRFLGTLMSPYIAMHKPVAVLSRYCLTYGQLLAHLPESHWTQLIARVILCMQHTLGAYSGDVFRLLNWRRYRTLSECADGGEEEGGGGEREGAVGVEPIILLTVAHGFISHASPGQMCSVLGMLRHANSVRTTTQLIYLCHLVVPFLDRLSTSSVFEVTRLLYDSLQQVDACSTSSASTSCATGAGPGAGGGSNHDNCAQSAAGNYGNSSRNGANSSGSGSAASSNGAGSNSGGSAAMPESHINALADLFYHIKYMHTGNSTKAMAEKIIRSLRPTLQMKLRFITYLNIEEITAKEEVA